MTAETDDPWVRARRSLALDDVSRSDFAQADPATRLARITVQLAVIPAGADADTIELDRKVWNVLEEHRRPAIGGVYVELGVNECPTAHTACRYNGHNGRLESWTTYVAIHRSGVVSAGLGDQGARLGRTRDGGDITVFRLAPVVAYTQAVLQLHAAAVEQLGLAGPFELVVGVTGAKDSMISGFGEGWPSPFDFGFDGDLHPCPVDNLLWRLHFDAPDGETGAANLAYAVGERLEGAFGGKERRFLDHGGPQAGKLNLHC